MRIVWSATASRSFDNIVRFIVLTHNVGTAKRFTADLHKLLALVKANPFIASEEQTLVYKGVVYRSIMIDIYNKIIYTVENDEILIADIWDTRMDPDNLKHRIK